MIDISLTSREELQANGLPLSAHYAYSLGTPQGLSLEKESCDWEMGVYEALLLDYNTKTLTISVSDLAEHGCVTRAELTSLELGEDAIKNPHSASKARKPITDTQTQTHYNSIRQDLEDFLSQHTLLQDPPSDIGADWKPLRGDIRAVILSGDASLEGFDRLRTLLREIFSSLRSAYWLKDSIAPKDMAAVGTAKRTMHIVHRPEDFHAHVQHVDHSHDEL